MKISSLRAVDRAACAVQSADHMNSDLSRDLITSHGLLNYLHASYQGRWAFLNALDQIGSASFGELEIVATREVLEKVNVWLSDLYRGSPIISATWTQPETFDAIKAVDYLRATKKEIAHLSQVISQVLGTNAVAVGSEEAKLLTAAFARYAYARDSYIRGFLEYGQAANNPDMLRIYEPFLVGSGEDLQVAHFLLHGFTARERDPDHHSILLYRAQIVPGIFRTHAHDMNQILATFSGGFSFMSADFTSTEASAWNQSGFGPVAAGYWRAYDFLPADAAEWSATGVTEAGAAVEWRKHGFTASDVQHWVALGFPPLIARRWREQGYSAERALPFVQQGITTPDKIPPPKNNEEEE
jgi:hypothetical protein